MTAQSILAAPIVEDRGNTMPAKQKPASDAQDEAGLIARAQEGDERAVSQLYHQYAPGIYGYIASRVGDPAVADDLTSEAFLRALEGLPQFEVRGVPLSAWLYRIAHDRMVDHFRRQARRPTIPLEDGLLSTDELYPPRGGIDEHVEARLRTEQLNKAIERLTAEQHQVILLRFVAGFKLHEIAYVMDKSTSAIKMLQFRALTRLREWVASADTLR
jgi:RNA polymerase sigma-70 factor (ECF subfamily)